MSGSDKILYMIFTLLGISVGLAISKIFTNIPFFEWDNKVDVVSLLGLILTLCIAIGIPLLLKKLIDDNRNVKSFLAEEVKDLIVILCEIREIISACYEGGKITVSDKDKINYIFHRADLQIVSIQDQMDISFSNKTHSILTEMKKEYFEYHNHTTGGVLMNSKFNVVDDSFRRKHDTLQSNFITHLKGVIHKIHKF